MSDPSAVKSLLARHGFTFSKSLGQNFLINPSVCPRMAEECGAGPGTGVLEVGPGIGVLTVELAKRAEKVVSIELDKRLLPVLHETLGNHPNAKVVNDDVLKVDLQRLLQEEFAGMDVVVCANLPYYITSPVIMRLLEERLPIRALTVMVQKEAAQRLCAPPGTRACGRGKRSGAVLRRTARTVPGVPGKLPAAAECGFHRHPAGCAGAAADLCAG